MPKLINKKYTIDTEMFTMYRYIDNDEEVKYFKCFESFAEAQQELVKHIEERQNLIKSMKAKDVK